MSLSSIPAVASTSLAVNQARLDASAHRVASMSTLRSAADAPASSGSPPSDAGGAPPDRSSQLLEADRQAQQITRELINQRVELYHFKANVGVVQTSSQAMGTLLDLAG